MTDGIPLTIMSAKDAKARFGELLKAALGRPVGITEHDRLTAYVVSKHDFEKMLADIDDLEDQLWLARAELARKDGFAEADRVDAVLSDLRKAADAEASDI